MKKGQRAPTSTAVPTKGVRSTRPGRRTTAKAGGATSTGKKRSKYNARGQHIDGQWFASQSEAIRYLQLQALQEKGCIDALECQVKLPVRINNLLVCNYVADFRYAVIDERGSTERIVIEDVKGMMTDLYKLKRKLVMACHQLTIQEIPAAKIADWSDRTG